MEIPAWQPSAAVVRAAKITAFSDWLAAERGLRFADYDALWRWSVSDLEGFWGAIWDWFAIPAATPPARVLADPKMPGARWFPGATLNYVDQVFRHATDARPAIVSRNEAGITRELTWAELQRVSGAVAARRGRMASRSTAPTASSGCATSRATGSATGSLATLVALLLIARSRRVGPATRRPQRARL